MRRAGKWQAERCWLVPTLLHLSSVTHSHTHTHSHTQTPINESEKSFARPPFVSGPPEKDFCMWHESSDHLNNISEKSLRLLIRHTMTFRSCTYEMKQSKINWRASFCVFCMRESERIYIGDLSVLVFCAHITAKQLVVVPNLSNFRIQNDFSIQA